MKKLCGVVMLGTILGFCGSQAYAAPLQNAGFETGDLSDWNSVTDGDATVQVVQTDKGYSPPEGVYFAKLSSGDNSLTGSSLSQALQWSAGDLLIFDWNYYSTDNLKHDAAGFSIEVPTHLVTNITLAAGEQQTGWQTYTYAFTESGIGAVRFWVRNGADQYVSSYLYLDAVTFTVTSGPGSPVPEPATMLLMALGATGLFGSLRNRRSLSNKR